VLPSLFAFATRTLLLEPLRLFGRCHRDCHSLHVTGRNWPQLTVTVGTGPLASKSLKSQGVEPITVARFAILP